MGSLVAAAMGLQLRRVGFSPTGPDWHPPVVADCDHDGMTEVVYACQDSWPVMYWGAAEYAHVNRYSVVKADSAPMSPYPQGFLAASFQPFDAGDLDDDGLVDLVGRVKYRVGDTIMYAVGVFECPDSFTYPDTSNRHFVLRYGPGMLGIEDMDRDSLMEIVCSGTPRGQEGGTLVFENTANNQESLVFQTPPGSCGAYPVADYDQNGRLDFPTSSGVWVRVCECVGDNQYAVVCSLGLRLANGYELFGGGDVDGNGRPEFFVVDMKWQGLGWQLYLHQFEAVSEHNYTWYTLDSERIGSSVEPSAKTSICVDTDGDGTEEVIWSCVSRIIVMKATGPHQYERVAYWWNPAGAACFCSAFDMNGNGYNEVLVGGCRRVSVLEVEAVRVLNPDRTGELEDGDTCEIRWRVFTPPRCDSVSLFLKTDTVVREGERFWRLDTIVTGLAPTESSYAWVVPETTLAWARVLAIAYGPGWQYDESDSAFRIRRAGIEQGPHAVPAWRWQPPTVIRGAVRVPQPRPGQDVPALTLYDGQGRRAAELRPGVNDLRRLAPGVYFVRMADGEGRTANAKVVIAK